MCLFLNHLIPKIADKDIICYKYVKRTKVKGVYKASIQRFEYIIRRLYTNNININCIGAILHTEYRRYGIHYISNFMFHSYKLPVYTNTLVKCIIPKGAYYFEGSHNGIWGYASSQIKILEEIKI